MEIELPTRELAAAVEGVRLAAAGVERWNLAGICIENFGTGVRLMTTNSYVLNVAHAGNVEGRKIDHVVIAPTAAEGRKRHKYNFTDLAAWLKKQAKTSPVITIQTVQSQVRFIARDDTMAMDIIDVQPPNWEGLFVRSQYETGNDPIGFNSEFLTDAAKSHTAYCKALKLENRPMWISPADKLKPLHYGTVDGRWYGLIMPVRLFDAVVTAGPNNIKTTENIAA